MTYLRKKSKAAAIKPVKPMLIRIFYLAKDITAHGITSKTLETCEKTKFKQINYDKTNS